MIRHARLLAPLIVPMLLAPVARGVGEDLRDVYPATMNWSQSGLFPICGTEDVWKLKSFEFRFGKDLEIKCKKATVAFGRHETNVLWAAVFPEKPTKIKSSGPGHGERAETIFLRVQMTIADQQDLTGWVGHTVRLND